MPYLFSVSQRLGDTEIEDGKVMMVYCSGEN